MRKVKILSVIVVLWMSVSTPASGTGPMPGQNGSARLYGISAGLLEHDVDGLWSNSPKEGGVDFNAEIVFSHPGFSLPLGIVLANFGLSINDRGGTSKIYAGLLWEVEVAFDIFMNLGVGVAVHDGELEISGKGKNAFGSRVLFRIPIEVGYALTEHHRVSIAFDHVSNADLADPNDGLDTFGLRYSYRF